MGRLTNCGSIVRSVRPRERAVRCASDDPYSAHLRQHPNRFLLDNSATFGGIDAKQDSSRCAQQV